MAKDQISNWGLLLYVLDQLELENGREGYIHLEEIFDKAWKLAPDRFSWKTKDYPSYKTMHTSLSSIDQKGLPYLIKSSDLSKRKLTQEGIQWAEENRSKYKFLLKDAEGKTVVNVGGRSNQQKYLLNFETNNELYKLYIKGKNLGRLPGATDKYKLADMVKVVPSSPKKTWNKRIKELISGASHYKRKGLVSFFYEIWELNTDLFGEENEY